MDAGSPTRKQLDVSTLIIDGDWRVGDLKTVEDCDLAMTSLKVSIDKLKDQLDDYQSSNDRDWVRRARSALTLKQAAYSAVQALRRSFNTAAKSENMRKDALLIEAKKLIPHDKWDMLVERVNAQFGVERPKKV